MYLLRNVALAAALFYLTTGEALAAELVTASNAWVRATVPGQSVAAAYFDITANAPATQVAIETAAAGKAELHTMSMDAGVMKMRPVGRLDLPAHQTVRLAPGGYHVMLVDIKHALKAGDRVPLTLVFEDRKGVKSKLGISAEVRGTVPHGADKK